MRDIVSTFRKMSTESDQAQSPAQMTKIQSQWLGLRSYVVAFEAKGKLKSLPKLADETSQALKAAGNPAHLHGVLVPNLGFLRTRAVDAAKAVEADYFHVLSTSPHPLLAFKTMLLRDLATFDRPQLHWTPAFDVYMESVSDWATSMPLSNDLLAESVDPYDDVNFVD